jgi:hypothetical protein
MGSACASGCGADIGATIEAPLDPNFKPVYKAKKEYQAKAANCTDTLEWALPRPGGCAARGKLKVFPESDEKAQTSVEMANVLINNMMWERAANALHLAGPEWITKKLVEVYHPESGSSAFETNNMPNACGTPEAKFEVKVVAVADLPDEKDEPQECGTDASGTRLAFDLGKSDIKVVCVKDNQVFFSSETVWDVTAEDPEYHFKAIKDALLKGIEHATALDPSKYDVSDDHEKSMKECVENALAKGAKPGDFKKEDICCLGGSATGAISADSEAVWCDIFPNVPPGPYKEHVVKMFHRLRDEVIGKEKPLKVINDGEVTALAAYAKLGKKGNVLGISMGSSEGGGYADSEGRLLGWINELCFLQIDLNPEAYEDPWTKKPGQTFAGHRGMSHLYLGQRGATKLVKQAGLKDIPENLTYPHPEMCTIKHENHAKCLKLIQKAMKGDNGPEEVAKASKIYETVGVYLGYGLAMYMDETDGKHYNIEHVMILGRVSKGDGGKIVLDTAKKVLEAEGLKVPQFHEADDHFKAVGQCIAAAALPKV